MPPVLLARLADIPEGGMIGRVHGIHEIALQIALELTDRTRHDEVLPRARAGLACGPALGREGDYCVTCPWHEAHFDFRTGKVEQDTPWAVDTRTYPVELRGDEVWVDLP